MLTVERVPATPAPMATILLGCAHGDTAAAHALRGWDDGRVPRMLARSLGEPSQAQAAFERLLADLASESGAFSGGSETAAQDWLFARMRLAMRKAGDGRPAPRLYAVPTHRSPAEKAPAPPPGTASDDAPSAPAAADETGPDLSQARLRRPSAPVHSAGIRAVPVPSDKPPRRRFRLRLLLVLLAAIPLACGLVLLRLPQSPPNRPVEVTEPMRVPEAVRPPVPASPPPPAVVAVPPPPAPASLAERLGPPLEAPEPPVVAAPVERPVAAPPPSEQPALPVRRIVVHHGGQAESRAVAEQLASQLLSASLGDIEVRAVPFDVATASVRYFFDQDRADAQRLTAAIGPFLNWHGRAVPATAIGFTDYRPLPRQGTIEVWLPRR